MTTTVLVLSVDEAPLLARSLPAIVGQGAEVVVVDNACTDATVEVAERAGARPLRLAHRVSYAAALNAAIGATGGDAVLLLNADCVAAPGFVAALERRLAADERVGSVAPKLLRAAGLEEADRLDEVDAAGIVVTRTGRNLLVGHGAPARAYARPGEVFAADGAAALWRRAVLEDVAVGSEVLDEDMALWATESDLAWRAQLRGWRCAYEPAAVAWHVRSYRPSADRTDLPAAHRRLQFRNRLLMLAKNATPTAALLPVLGYEIAALGHTVLRERALLGGYRDAWRLRRVTLERRRVVQSRRTVRVPPFGLRPER